MSEINNINSGGSSPNNGNSRGQVLILAGSSMIATGLQWVVVLGLIMMMIGLALELR